MSARRLGVASVVVLAALSLGACNDDGAKRCAAKGGTIKEVPDAPIYVQVGKVMVPMDQAREACIRSDGSEVVDP